MRVLLLLVLLLPMGVVHALTDEVNFNASRCIGQRESPATLLVPCNRAIESGELKGPVLATVHYFRGTVRMQLGDYDGAIADFDIVAPVLTKDFHIYANRGQSLYAIREYDRAIADFDAALRLQPEHSRMLRMRAVTRMLKGEFDPALADLDEAARVDPRNPEIHAQRAVTLMGQGQVERAMAEFNLAIELDPALFTLYIQRGRAWREQGNYARTLADFDKAVSLEPKRAATLRARGQEKFYNGDYALAAADIANALALDPANRYGALWLHIARQRGKTGDGRAELMATRATSTQEDWPTPIMDYFLGRIDAATLRARAASGNARQQRERACEVTFYLGQARAIAGERDAARDLFQEASASCPATYIEYTAATMELKRD